MSIETLITRMTQSAARSDAGLIAPLLDDLHTFVKTEIASPDRFFIALRSYQNFLARLAWAPSEDRFISRAGQQAQYSRCTELVALVVERYGQAATVVAYKRDQETRAEFWRVEAKKLARPLDQLLRLVHMLAGILWLHLYRRVVKTDKTLLIAYAADGQLPEIPQIHQSYAFLATQLQYADIGRYWRLATRAEQIEVRSITAVCDGQSLELFGGRKSAGEPPLVFFANDAEGWGVAQSDETQKLMYKDLL